jgi:hypothetical protein
MSTHSIARCDTNHLGSEHPGPAPDLWATLRLQRRLLVVVHTVVGATRLLTVAALIASDPRVQVVFTQAPDQFGRGVDTFLTDRGCVLLPWQAACRESFDVALAASYGEMHHIQARLVLMPHGVGHHKLATRRPGTGRPLPRTVYGFEREHLIRDGRLVPCALVLSHEEQRGLLARSCPEALPTTVVAGDPCYDQLAAALPRRLAFRRALGADDGRRLVVVTSTWGPHSLLSQQPDLLCRMVDELPASRYRVVAVLHPHVWTTHSEFQIRHIHQECLRRGLALTPLGDGWLAAVLAADWVVGDHGSVALYGTVSGAAVLLATFPRTEVALGSPPDALAAVAPRLRHSVPLEPQLAAAGGRGPYQGIASRISSQPCSFARNIRRLIYQQLCLGEPETEPHLPHLRPPSLITG